MRENINSIFMIRISIFIVLSSYLNFKALAQEALRHPTCHAERMNTTQVNSIEWQQFETTYASVMSSGNMVRRRSPVALPVVFHIIHENGPENISDAQVESGLLQLNQAFANTGYYDMGTGVNTQIQFCLASQDPNGQATNGITRQSSSLSQHEIANDLNLKSLVHWDPNAYINIYIVARICDQSNCAVIGYSSFPPSHGDPDDGIVMEAEFLGSSESNNTVLVHEMGHFLGLYHTFNQGCTNNDCLTDGDRVCDTPPDQTTGGPPCIFPVNTCTSDEDDTSANNPFRSTALGGLGDQPDMVNNYMDYSDLTCFSAFTQGQSDRMCLAIQTTRQSLVNSSACDDPCPMPIVLNILQDDIILPLGSNQLFESYSENVTDFEWTINGEFESNASSFSYIFNEEGIYELILLGENDDALCRGISDTIIIEVVCPAQADFLPVTRGCIDLGTSISFINNSTGTSTFEWYVDDQFYSADEEINYTFNVSGDHSVMLIAVSTVCRDTFFHIFSVDCSESCSNGYDDDGDMLVDQYDPKCCEPTSLYNFLCDSACYDEVPLNTNMEVEWVSPVEASYVFSPAIGDLDGDGQTEIISIVRGNFIARIDGSTGNEIMRFPGNSDVEGGVAIGDLDNDGFGEILAITKQGLVECYDHDGTFKYISDERIPLVFPTLGNSYVGLYPSMADFNQDGQPEFYIGNQIFNGQTGEQICSGGSGARGIGNTATPVNDVQKLMSVAIDILPDNYCATCQGLELVAGNQIYAINIATQEIQVVSENLELRDGFTSVVDFDLDGDLDVVGMAAYYDLPDVMSMGPGLIVYAWDGQTPTTLGKYEVRDWSVGEVSEQVVGNFDDDPFLEIAFHVFRGLILIDDDFSVKWQIQTADGSATSALGFDFNQDEILELVYRDDAKLGIYDGRTGSLLSSTPMSSGTAAEYFAMADVDNDQSIEIITYGDITPPFIGGYHCVGSAGLPAWPNSYSTFNQSMFFNVNINNDLSVPPQQQNPHLVGNKKILNNFRVPLSIPVPSIDASVDSIEVFCDNGPQISFVVCNEASTTIQSDFPITIYCGSPTSATTNAIATMTLGQLLEKDECQRLTVALTSPCINKIHVVANDDQSISLPFDQSTFPLTSIYECEYNNNIGAVDAEQSGLLDLGADETLCPGMMSIELNASDNFETYEWDDGSTDSIRIVTAPGIYWVEVVDTCGRVLRDSITVLEYEDSPTLSLGNDTFFCAFGVLTIDAGAEYHRYQWSDGSTDQTFTAWQPGTYSVTVEDACAITQTDDIILSVLEPDIIDIGNDTTICLGDSILLSLPGFNSHQWGIADGISCPTCPSTYIKPTETSTYYVVAQNGDGCFVSDSITIFVEPYAMTELSFELCPNDSIFISDQWITTSGSYTFAFQTDSYCDSLVSVDVNFYETSTLETSPGESIQIGDQVILSASLNGMDPLETYWFPPEDVNCSTCPMTTSFPTENTTFFVEAYDENNCVYYDSIDIEVLVPGQFYIPSAFSPNNDGINDVFFVHAVADEESTYSVKIFNRWGGKVFERNNIRVNDSANGWDGWQKNKAMESGLFIYEIVIYNNTFTLPFKGEINLFK